MHHRRAKKISTKEDKISSRVCSFLRFYSQTKKGYLAVNRNKIQKPSF